jgi:hypothetical protein
MHLRPSFHPSSAGSRTVSPIASQEWQVNLSAEQRNSSTIKLDSGLASRRKIEIVRIRASICDGPHNSVAWQTGQTSSSSIVILECGDASPLSIPWILLVERMEESKATMHRRTPRSSPTHREATAAHSSLLNHTVDREWQKCAVDSRARAIATANAKLAISTAPFGEQGVS